MDTKAAVENIDLGIGEFTGHKKPPDDNKSGASNQWWWPWAILERITIVVLLLALFAAVLIVIANIIKRSFSTDIEWSDEACLIMINIVAFMGGAVAFRRRQFTSVNWFGRFFNERRDNALHAVSDVATLVVTVVLAVVSWQFCFEVANQIDPFLHISEFWVDVPIAIGTSMMAFFSIERLWLNRQRFGIIPFAVAGFAIGVLAFLHYVVVGTTSTTVIIVIIGVIALLLISFGFPLPIAFSAGGLGYAYLAGIPLLLAPSDLLDGTSSFILVAIPFFLLTGFLMSVGGLSTRLARGIRAIIGHVPGAMLHVITLSMFIFSGISGSKIGDMAAVGKSAVEMAEQEGYPSSEAVAALAAGAAMGDTLPPSIALIVLSSVSFLSLGALFVAGILPAVAVAIALTGLILFRNRHRKISADLGNRRERLKMVGGSLPVVLLPVLIVGSIVSGISTPTETAAVAVVLSMVFIVVAYRQTSVRALLAASTEAAILGGIVLMMLATATLFARALTLAKLPQELATLASSHSLGGKWGFLFLSAAILIVMGMLMEGLPALLVFAPLLLPVASLLGINSLQYGIMIVIAIGIGVHMPPIGIGLYVGAQIGQVDVKTVCRKFYPYLVPLVAGLVVVICWPQVVTWLPNVLHIS